MWEKVKEEVAGAEQEISALDGTGAATSNDEAKTCAPATPAHSANKDASSTMHLPLTLSIHTLSTIYHTYAGNSAEAAASLAKLHGGLDSSDLAGVERGEDGSGGNGVSHVGVILLSLRA